MKKILLLAVIVSVGLVGCNKADHPTAAEHPNADEAAAELPEHPE